MHADLTKQSIRKGIRVSWHFLEASGPQSDFFFRKNKVIEEIRGNLGPRAQQLLEASGSQVHIFLIKQKKLLGYSPDRSAPNFVSVSFFLTSGCVTRTNT